MKIVLQPYKVRSPFLVRDRAAEALTFTDWPTFEALFTSHILPAGEAEERKVIGRALNRLRLGNLVGLTRSSDPTQPARLFTLDNADRRGSIEAALSQDPTIAERIQSVYEVIEFERDVVRSESEQDGPLAVVARTGMGVSATG